MSDEMLWQILGHLVCFAQLTAFVLVEWAYLGKGRVRHPIFWAVVLGAAEMAATLVFDIPFFSPLSIAVNAAFLLLCSLLFGGTPGEKFNACLINGVMCLLTENTVNYTYSWFTGVVTGEAWRSPMCLAMLCAANLLAGSVAAHFMRGWSQRNALQPLQAMVVSFFPGVAVALNMLLMASGTREPATLLTMLLTLGMSVAVLVHIAIVQMFNDQVVQRQSSQFRAQLEKQRAEALLDSYTAQRRLTHEFTNHMSALSALLEQGDLAGAQEYLAGVSKAVASATTIMNTHNPLLDSILSKKYEEAAKKGVTVYFDLCDLKDLPFDGTDMVIVLSNLLDNAVRAAADALPPEVYVRIRKTQDEYLFSVRNRVQENLELTEDGQLPRSTKLEPGHGMGLLNVQEVLKRYGAEYTVSCRDKWFRFTCSLPIHPTGSSCHPDRQLVTN